jgi:hypothetical protein
LFELKRLSKSAIPTALEKAERYRLLNEPLEAESICRDVLNLEPKNQAALVMLLLALTDQFDREPPAVVTQARGILPLLQSDYERTYYAGIICERRAKARLEQVGPGSESFAYSSLREAMECYEKAEAIRPAGNDDALLRWNTCARIIQGRHLEPAPEERFEPPLE